MKKIYSCIALILCFSFSEKSFSQIVINEGTNKNFSIIADEEGDYPDWIELYNAGASPVDLFNYSLTDDTLLPTQWVFPHCTMPSHSYLLVFCSQKNRVPTTGFTDVVSSTSFLPAAGWNTHTFTTPFYWDGVSNIVINVCSYNSTGYTINSVFNQTATPYLSTISAFQDGSAASCSFTYGSPAQQRPNLKLNNAVIGTGTVQNNPYTYPAPYGNWYWGARTQMLIRASELSASGLSAGNINSLSFDVASPDPCTYDYIDISMNLTTHTSTGSMFQQSAATNNYHTNFKIDGAGETVYLYSPSQNQLSQLLVSCINPDNSTGLLPDASAATTLFSPATPAATNNLSTSYTGYAQPPTFSIASGFYSAMQNVSMTNPNAFASVIRYTTDGSEPVDTSTLYTAPLPVFYTSVLRARVFAAGYLPSTVTTSSYFFGVSHLTPVLSVVTDNANLYGAAGIFDNYYDDWDKPAYAEYFDSTQQLIFSQRSKMVMDGGAGGSRSHPQHSFRLGLADGVLGENPVNYALIPDKPDRDKYSNIYLRNGSNQYLVLPYKDACQVKSMCGETNNYYSAWRPVSVYINGNYFGLYEMREKFDAEYFKTFENANPDSTSILSLSYFYGGALRSLQGPVDTFWNNYTAWQNLITADTGYWNKSDKYFDMKYYEDYIIGQSWMGNVDWPGNNIKLYRSDKTNQRWRFCIIDQELAMAPNSWTDCYYDHINFLLTQDPNNPYINIFLRGIQNNRFRDYFINRFADMMNTTYQFSRIGAVEQNMFDQTVFEMQNEFYRWGNPNDVPGQMTDFYNNHLTFRTQLAARTAEVRDDIQAGFSLPQQVVVLLDAIPAGAGKIKISTITPDTYPWGGVYFDGLPVKIEAIANPGFHFLHWGNNPLLNDTLNSVFLDTIDISFADFTAYFGVNVGIDEVTETAPAFSVYPSPATDNIFVVNRNEKLFSDCNYQVIDLTGKIILNGKLSVNASTTSINIFELSPSVYAIQISDANGLRKQLRFVKVKE